MSMSMGCRVRYAEGLKMGVDGPGEGGSLMWG
jgi:hypothetical protein